MRVDTAACGLDVELRERRVRAQDTTSTWSTGAGSSLKNLSSRWKSVASKAAMLASARARLGGHGPRCAP